jgi:2-dehydropantoate 2-reductase
VSSPAYVIVGSGTIGGIIGAFLAADGKDVLLIDSNAAHVSAINADGFTITGLQPMSVRVPAMHTSQLNMLQSDIPFIILAVKADATTQALAPLVPLLSPQGVVLTVQNGLELYRVAELVGAHRALGGCVSFGGHFEAPGHVSYAVRGDFSVGSMSAGSPLVSPDFQRSLAGPLSCRVTSNILGKIWGKLAIVAMWTATAIVDEDVPVLLRDAHYHCVFTELSAEVLRVAAAVGVSVEPSMGLSSHLLSQGPERDRAESLYIHDQLSYWDSVESPDGLKRTGAWRDLALRNLRSEVHVALKDVTSLGARSGVSTTMLSALDEMVSDVERGIRTRTPANLNDLLTTLRPESVLPES